MRGACAFVLASALSGCGLLVDLDPPDDAGSVPSMDAGRADGGAGMDAARPDAGPPAECREDSDCDDGLFCNGAESCALGLCEGGAAVVCDDGIDCTIDRCDEEDDACEVAPDDGACATLGVPCLGARCVEGVGCVGTRDDAECDDGIGCTIDRCAPAGCEHRPADALCSDDEYCNPVASAGDSGCEPIPECTRAADCPALPCNAPPSCEGGACTYAPISVDPACGSLDPCTPVYCDEGACVTGAPVLCGATEPGGCSIPTCHRDASGRTVTCMDAPRTGPCTPTTPCRTGTCDADGNCVETNACPPPSNACRMPVCVGGGCGEVTLSCGPNASCVVESDGSAACQCAPGWTRCTATEYGCNCPRVDAGVDAGAQDASIGMDPRCTLPGQRDCDGDGTCECAALLSRCDMGRCECLLLCGLGLQCCRNEVLDIGYCGEIGTCRVPG